MCHSCKITGLIVAAAVLASCSGAPNPRQIASRMTGPCGPVIAFADPDWSPDGTRILYTSTTFGSYRGYAEIWTMTPAGKDARLLTNSAKYHERSAWSPDGTKIAFVSERDGNPEIYRMNSDGTEQVRLTDDPAEDIFPVWSPDGNRIAFLSARDGYHPMMIYVMDSDGNSQTPLAGVVDFSTMAWSPDGKVLFYGHLRDTGYGVDWVNTETADHEQLTDEHMIATWPSLSPDGQHIAFYGRYKEEGAKLQLYVINRDGTGLTELTHDDGYYSDPAWSPDGKQIAFLSGDGNIHVINSDGTGQRQLTHDVRWQNAFTWSPDSSRILFVEWPLETVSELYMVDTDPAAGASGSNQTRLTTNPANQTCLQWPF